MGKITKEEVERAMSTYYDFDGDLSVCTRAVLEEFVANREKEEASEPTDPCPKCESTAKVQAGDMSVHECDKCYNAWETASETKVCEYCGPKCYGGAAHNERVENGDRYTDNCAEEAEPLIYFRDLEAAKKFFGIAEPTKTPEDRVVIKKLGNLWDVYLDGVHQYAGKESTVKVLYYDLIAQLYKEAK